MDALKRLYAVETLDTRFKSRTGQPLPNTRPAKWNTPEYYFYYFIFLTIPPLMVEAVYDVSGDWHPTYLTYEPLLSEGWIPGRKVDNSDAQYRSFRDNIPYTAAFVVLHPLLRKAYELFQNDRSKSEDQTAKAADLRMNTRIRYDVAFATIFLIALHGVSAAKILLIMYLNYKIATTLPRKYAPSVTWIFNIGVLFANEIYRGYPFERLAGGLLPPGPVQAELEKLGAWVDGYGGLVARWEVLFNITVLRLISFNFDYLWSLDHQAVSPIEKKNLDPANLSERDRVSIPPKPADFSFRNYFAYVLYSPLYLAGPILNFNDYISQQRYQLPSINVERTTAYAIRFVVCLLTMELVLHFLYAVAICNAKPDYTQYTPFQLSMLGYFNLHVVWLKLLIPWRLFRLWALIDGIDPPENMVRCMSDNYSALAFWRGFHRSYNRWLVRYIYVPLGGSGKSKLHGLFNFLVVFTFVALWHDLQLRLLAWGWLISLFVLPELIATFLFPAKKWQDSPETYRVLCGIGAVGNILMMMAANLVGFAVGLDGLKGLVEGIISSLGGRMFFLAACATLFVGAQMMFEVRQSEKRRGVNMPC